MVGIFDSGTGGLTALNELRKIAPGIDVCFFADRENAPYGTKSKKELIRLVERDISKLCSAGANKILMACCTASTVYGYLPISMRDIACPIIEPTAKEAALVTGNGRVGVIATNATVASSAFTNELSKYYEVKQVFEFPAQQLVSLVEDGINDKNMPPAVRDALYRLLLPLRRKDIDTLILGCTHFAKLEREISGCLPGVRIVSSSKEGAKKIVEQSNSLFGKGKTLYLEN